MFEQTSSSWDEPLTGVFHPGRIEELVQGVNDEGGDIETAMGRVMEYMDTFYAVSQDMPGYIIERYIAASGDVDYRYIQKSKFHIEASKLTDVLGRPWFPSRHWYDRHGGKTRFLRVVFDPKRDSPGCLNMYSGLVESSRARLADPFFEEHVLKIICDGDLDMYNYVIRWMAQCVQTPWKRNGVGIALIGRQGSGKGTFGHKFGSVFTPSHYSYCPTLGSLTGYNKGSLHRKIVIFCDEVHADMADKRAISILKTLVTEPIVKIEEKYEPSMMQNNYANIILATNDRHCISAEPGERRWLCLRVSSDRAFTYNPVQSASNREYFQRMHTIPPESVCAWLRAVDLAGFHSEVLPWTPEISRQKMESADPCLRWIFSILQVGMFSESLGEGRVDRTEPGVDFSEARLTTQSVWSSYSRPGKKDQHSFWTVMRGCFGANLHFSVYDNMPCVRFRGLERCRGSFANYFAEPSFEHMTKANT